FACEPVCDLYLAPEPLTPSPFPNGEGETGISSHAVLTPSPPFPGERGNRTPTARCYEDSDSGPVSSAFLCYGASSGAGFQAPTDADDGSSNDVLAAR